MWCAIPTSVKIDRFSRACRLFWKTLDSFKRRPFLRLPGVLSIHPPELISAQTRGVLCISTIFARLPRYAYPHEASKRNLQLIIGTLHCPEPGPWYSNVSNPRFNGLSPQPTVRRLGKFTVAG